MTYPLGESDCSSIEVRFSRILQFPLVLLVNPAMRVTFNGNGCNRGHNFSHLAICHVTEGGFEPAST